MALALIAAAIAIAISRLTVHHPHVMGVCQIFVASIFALAYLQWSARSGIDQSVGWKIAFPFLFGFLALSLDYNALFIAAAFTGLAMIRRQFPGTSARLLIVATPFAMICILALPLAVEPHRLAARLWAHWRMYHKPALILALLGAGFVLNLFQGRKLTAVTFLKTLAGIVVTTLLVRALFLRGSIQSDGTLFVRGIIQSDGYIGLLLAMALAFAFAAESAASRAWSAGRTVCLAIVIGVLVWPIIARGREAWTYTPVSCANIHDQQYQMARFVNEFYPGTSIALNDIGAVSYFDDIHLLDIMGLDNAEIARHRVHDKMTSKLLEDIASREQVRIAIAYQAWATLYGPLPKSWEVTGAWQIPNNFICFSDYVHFYAVRPGEAALLRKNLEAFKARLPKGVKTYEH